MSVVNSNGSGGSWGPTPDQSASVDAGAKARSNADIREGYNEKISSAYEDTFKTKFKEFHDNEQCFGEDLAREAYEARSKIKTAAQSETSWLGRAAIWVRNMFTYGGANATYDGLSKTKNPEEIGYSAFKTGGSDLGLKNNGFGEKLDVWNAIKEVTTLYPEDVTPAMLAEYKSQLAAHQGKGAFKADVDAILAAGGMSPDPALNPFGSKEKNVKIHV